MAKAQSKCIIIDASIARSAGGPSAVHPLSKACRDTLSAVLTVCHRLGFTPDLAREWKIHRSRFAITWLASMYARKKIVRVNETQRLAIDAAIKSFSKSETILREMLKDAHLVSGALDSDSIIFALDEDARRRFAVFCGAFNVIGSVQWINPGIAKENCITWLNGGAQFSQNRTLTALYATMDDASKN